LVCDVGVDESDVVVESVELRRLRIHLSRENPRPSNMRKNLSLVMNKEKNACESLTNDF
jgi:hypothetical protein